MKTFTSPFTVNNPTKPTDVEISEGNNVYATLVLTVVVYKPDLFDITPLIFNPLTLTLIIFVLSADMRMD